MTKTIGSKALGIFLALAMVFSLVGMMAIPPKEVEAGGQAATPNPTFVTYDMTENGPSTPADEISIGWTDAKHKVGNHSIHVKTTTVTKDYAQVVIPTDFTLSGDTTISCWGYAESDSGVNEVNAPDEIFLFFEDGTVLSNTNDDTTTGSWAEWTPTDETTPTWDRVTKEGTVEEDIDLSDYHGKNVIGIALGAGSPTSESGANVDVYLDNLVVDVGGGSGESYSLDEDTGVVVARAINGFSSGMETAKDAALAGDYIIGEIPFVFEAGSTYDIPIEVLEKTAANAFEPKGSQYVYIDDIGDDSLGNADLNTDGDGNTYSDSNDYDFISLGPDGKGTFEDVEPLYSTMKGGSTCYVGLEFEGIEVEGEAVKVKTEVVASPYSVEVSLNVDSLTYDSAAAVEVTVTKDGDPLPGATVKLYLDDEGDGQIDGGESLELSKTTSTSGKAPFSMTPDKAGLLIAQVTKDIGGKLSEPETTDDINDILNSSLQIPVEPIELTVEATPPELRKGWEQQPTYTVKTDDTEFTKGAAIWLKGTPLDVTDGEENYTWSETEFVEYMTDGNGHDLAKTDGVVKDGVIQSDTLFTPDETGTIRVKAGYNDAGSDKVLEYEGYLDHEVVEAAPLNVDVNYPEMEAGTPYDDLKVTIKGSDAKGPDGVSNSNNGNDLNWAKVVVSIPVGQSLATGEYYYFSNSGHNTGDADAGSCTDDPVTFQGVLPNDASSDITVTVTGELDDKTPVGPVTKAITVKGYKVTDIVPALGSEFVVGDVTDISMNVSTKEGVVVNNAKVTITAKEEVVDGFKKDVTGDEEKESFQTICINGSTNEITYAGSNAKTFYVNNGFYEVTDIEFAEVGDVSVEVQDDGDIKAKFRVAFSVLGESVYSLSFEPTKLTAGVDLDALDITVTEDDTAATDVDSITIDGKEFTGGDLSSADNVYTVNPKLFSEAKTLTVTAQNADGTKYGTADDLTVALPTVDYTIYETTVGEEEVERNVMLTNGAYTLDVTVNDALEALLDGYLWIGAYDAETEEFNKITDADIAPSLPINLDTDGTGEFDITAPDEETSLVWKIGGGDAVADAALLPTPEVSVEELYYDINPKEALQNVETTFTVTDNYGEPAADRDVKIVTLAIETVTKTTGPAGTPLAGKFMYKAPEAGDYYVSVKLGDTWQAPITVTVSPALVSIFSEPAEVSLVVDETQQLTITANYSDESETDVTAEVSYESNDKTVATVSDAGVITAVAEGTANITVSYTEGDITQEATVSVTVSLAVHKGDFDGDDEIDFDDFVAFGDAYDSVTGDPNYNVIGDFDEDNEINFDDFVAFGDVYGTTY